MLRPNITMTRVPDPEIEGITDRELSSDDEGNSESTNLWDMEDDQGAWEADQAPAHEQQYRTASSFQAYREAGAGAPQGLDGRRDEALASYLARLPQPELIDGDIFNTAASEQQARWIHEALNEVALPAEIEARAWLLNRAQQFVRYSRQYGQVSADAAFEDFLDLRDYRGAPGTLMTPSPEDGSALVDALGPLMDALRTRAVSPRRLVLATARLADRSLSSSEDEGYRADQNDVDLSEDDDWSDFSPNANRSPANSPVRAAPETPPSILGRRGREDFESHDDQSSDESSRPRTRRRLDSPRERDGYGR